MGTDGNAVDAAAGTPLEVDAVTVVTVAGCQAIGRLKNIGL